MLIECPDCGGAIAKEKIHWHQCPHCGSINPWRRTEEGLQYKRDAEKKLYIFLGVLLLVVFAVYFMIK